MRKVRKHQPWVEGIFWFILSVVGLILVIHSSSAIADGIASRSFESTTGYVVESDTRRKIISRSHESGTRRVSIHIFQYKYTVANKEFRSNQIRFPHTNVYKWKSSAEKQKKKYPASSNVTVFYQPDDPENSVLEPGVSLKSLITASSGFVLFVAGALGAFLRRKHWCREVD